VRSYAEDTLERILSRPLTFDEAYERSGIGRYQDDPVDRMYAEAFAPPWDRSDEDSVNGTNDLYGPQKEVSTMDNSALFTELLVAEVGRLRAQVEDLKYDINYHRGRAETLAVEVDRLRGETDRLYDEKAALRQRLDPFLAAEREREYQERQRALQEQLKAQFEGADPIDLLPKIKGWTKARKLKLVEKVKEHLRSGNKIPAIKHARDQFGYVTAPLTAIPGEYQRAIFGLKEAKDFVECVQAHMDKED